jgi:hypothetical protein
MFIVILVTAGLVIAVVTIHLAVLATLWRWIARTNKLTRYRMGSAILGTVVGHLLEIAVFAIGLHWLTLSGLGEGLYGKSNFEFRDTFYYSAVTYTSLGYGDITPVGNMRVFAAVEALTGLLMIAWTASFTFLIMQQYWPKEEDL